MLGALTHDVRYAARVLRMRAGFAIAATLTLALAIGANAAMFTVVDAVLVKPLPYAEADRLVLVSERTPSGLRNTVSPATFLDWRTRARSFTALSAFRSGTATLVDVSGPASVAAIAVTVDYLDTLGVSPMLGRTFRAGDAEPGQNPVIISNAAWRTRFGSDPGMLGRALQIDGGSKTVVGVLQPNAAFDGGRIEVLVPLDDASARARRDSHFLRVVGRLAPGASLASAQAEMDVVGAAIAAEFPATNAGWGVTVDPLAATTVDRTLRQSLIVLFGAVGLILLIGCANIGNLTLARAAGRRKELAIRSALGASRARIVRQLMTESAVLAVAGAAAAVLVGRWLLRVLTALMPPTLLPPHVTLSIDWRMLAFTAALGLGTAVLVGLMPAVVASRPDVNDALKQESRGAGASRRRQRVRSALVVSQVAMAVALLSGAALLVATLVQLLRVDPGFDPQHVLAMRVSLPSGRYPTPVETASFYRTTVERLGRVAGVQHAAASTSLPLRGWLFGEPFEIEGRAVDAARRPFAHFQSVTPDYFRTLGLPILAGRSFADDDDARGRPVLLINQTLADRFLGGEAAIGRHLVLDTGIGNQPQRTAWEIVGVVGRVKVQSLADAEGQSPEIYVPLAQAPVPAAWLSVRSTGDPTAVARAAVAAIAEVDPSLPVTSIGAMEQVVERSTLGARFRMRLLGMLAALAIGLASVGVYSVRAYTIGERVPEIGIRMALGASPSDIRRLMVREGARIVAAGVAIGLVAAGLLTRSLATLLFGVRPLDPFILAGAALTMMAVGLVATELPARRAARIDPVRALNRG
jgi:putative ABC transport system permease protein